MLNKFRFTKELEKIISNCKDVIVPKKREELVDLALGGKENTSFIIEYPINGKTFVEGSVVRCKNGVSVNFLEDYMRRRDPAAAIVADDKPTDKPTFKEIYKKDFGPIRTETFDWLANQELVILPFMAGGKKHGYEAIFVAPRNATFLSAALADLQYFVNIDEYEEEHNKKFRPKCVIYLAPPFRHTHFNGKQVVVHNRLDDVYEMFAYNLYPGPSAKKGVYAFLIDVGEREGWVAAHAAAVKVITPYDNEIIIMHEGASGGGKSEMGEQIHREKDGKLLLGENIVKKEKIYLTMNDTCELELIADDMALCHPKIQNKKSGKLTICDGEDGWFMRMDNIKDYGSEPFLERLCTHPKEPLVFLSLQGTPNATCLIWEHTLDSNGKRCPNPRAIIPRRLIDNRVDEPCEVDVRSFGVRTPPCTKDNPSYGIIGMLHIIPPALAWLWRLVAPRGHDNPSVADTKGMASEGVGSYWPFMTGKIVKQANLLLEQILNCPETRYVLIPNKHIGCYKVGFMPQWISREYIARRGSAKFKPEHLVPAKLPLLGYCLDSLKVDGQYIKSSLLRPEKQSEVGEEGYDAGAKILSDFFKKELVKYNTPELDPLGKKIIETCLNDGTLEDYINLIPMKY